MEDNLVVVVAQRYFTTREREEGPRARKEKVPWMMSMCAGASVDSPILFDDIEVHLTPLKVES
jgi:hypothetical protein